MQIHGKVQGCTETAVLVRCDVDPKAIEERTARCGNRCMIQMLDSRQISHEQRKKIYAIFGDVEKYQGEHCVGGKEGVKHQLKGGFISANEHKGYGWFSLGNCSVELAHEFINYLIEICFEYDVPTKESMIDRHDDITKYMYLCLKYRRCALCNAGGEIHHVDAIGMGNNRRTLDDSGHRKICLCRKHHQEAHTIGWTEFAETYHVKGILFEEESQ